MSEMAAVTEARRRRWWPFAGLAIAVVAVAVVAYLAPPPTEETVAPPATEETVAPPTVPDSVFSPAGTALPDGLRVPEGARLVGTPMTHEDPLFYYYGEPVPGRTWWAVLLVEGDVLDTWAAMRGVVAEALGVPLDTAADGVGCSTEPIRGFGCSTGGVLPTAEGGRLSFSAELQTVPGDVTGQYSILLRSERDLRPLGYSDPPRLSPDDPATRPTGPAPPAPEARPRPGVGEPLVTTGLPEDSLARPEDFVLMEGSQLLVQFAVNSNAGFGVLLRVLPGARVNDVAAEYAATPRLGGEPVKLRTTENEGQTVTSYRPVGEGGGYSGVIYAVDNTTGEDFIYYDVGSD